MLLWDVWVMHCEQVKPYWFLSKTRLNIYDFAWDLLTEYGYVGWNLTLCRISLHVQEKKSKSEKSNNSEPKKKRGETCPPCPSGLLCEKRLPRPREAFLFLASKRKLQWFCCDPTSKLVIQPPSWWSNLQVGDPTSKLVIQPPSWWDQIIHPSIQVRATLDVLMFFLFFLLFFFPGCILKSFESQWW